MLNVLIADDEVKVCKLIRCLIDWPALGLEVSGVVHNGLAALDFIREHQPDILITDIRMPGVDGLELIKQAKTLNADISFIIISGYNNFEYAQRAIKFGVEDYILKPIKKKEIVLSLKKIIEKHKSLEATQNEKNSLIQRIHTDEAKVRAAFLSQLIEAGPEQVPISTLDQINAAYYCNFTQSCYQMMIIQPIFYEPIEDEPLISFFTSKVENLIRSTFTTFHELLIVSKGERLYCLFNGNIEDMEILKKERKHLRNAITGLQDVFTKMKLYLFTSSIHHGIEHLPLCIQEATYASYDKLITYNSIIEYDPAAPLVRAESLITPQFRKNFIIAIETLDAAALSGHFEALAKRLHNSAANGKTIYDVYCELLSIYTFAIKNYNHNIASDKICASLYEDFNYYTNLNDLMGNFLSKVKQSINHYQAEKRQELSKPIRMAKQYINAHYHEALNLEMIGNEIGLNPSYFSSIFKRETGSSFVDYLNEVRIENAKHLLLEEQNSLTYICEAVGFHDMKYFTRRFKKLTGLSPTEYRKLYS